MLVHVAVFHLTSLPFKWSKAQLTDVNVCFQAGDGTYHRPCCSQYTPNLPSELPKISWGKKALWSKTVEYGGNTQQNKTQNKKYRL